MGNDTEQPDVGGEPIDAAKMLGRFTILQVVGAGGMGQVYAAYDPKLDRRVALTVLHASDDEVARQRLAREAQALARLSHPTWWRCTRSVSTVGRCPVILARTRRDPWQASAP